MMQGDGVSLRWLKDFFTSPRFPLLRGLFPNIGQAFRGWKLLFAVAAVAATLALAPTGFDNTIRGFLDVHHPLGGDRLRWVYFAFGQSWHVFLGLGIFRQGFRAGDDDKVAGGCAVLQSLLAVNIVVGSLKMLTGRPSPEVTADGSVFFRFNLADGDVMWPSGHTASAFAVASALHMFYRGRWWVPWAMYPLATFIGFSMLAGLFHWASDVAAGGLLGVAVGLEVGRQFRQWRDAQRA